MKKTDRLFPKKFLPVGSKGPATLVLQLLLQAMKLNPDIVADGDYGGQTAKGVRAFQAAHGLEEDGCFGPQTRAKFQLVTGVDVNNIKRSAFKHRNFAPKEAGVASPELAATTK